MSVGAYCDYCGRYYCLRDRAAGKRARCRECGTVFRVPDLPVTAASAGSVGSSGRPQQTAAPDPSGGSTVAAIHVPRVGRGGRMPGRFSPAGAGAALRPGGGAPNPRNNGAAATAVPRRAAARRSIPAGGPTAELVNFWVPRLLGWLSFGGVIVGGILTAHNRFLNPPIGYIILGLCLGMYLVMVVPLCVLGVRISERQFHFQLPKLTRQRIQITYAVPSAFGYLFFAQGGLWAAVPGALLGLFAAFFIMWLVLQLDLRNAISVFAAGSIMYVVSVVVILLVVWGLVSVLSLGLGPIVGMRR